MTTKTDATSDEREQYIRGDYKDRIAEWHKDDLEFLLKLLDKERADHAAFCAQAQAKTDADFKVTREAAYRARDELKKERQAAKVMEEALGDAVSLLESSLKLANADGAGFDIDADLKPLRRALKRAKQIREGLK